jgi:tetratricopeptide (TPR) repeat protein
VTARDHALRAGDEWVARLMSIHIAPGYLFGPAPVKEGLRWFDEHEALVSSVPVLMGQWAILIACEGRLDEARELILAAETRLRELGQRMMVAHKGGWTWHVERRGGDLEVAEAAQRASCELYEQIGERGWLSTVAGELGQTLCELGRYEEAGEWAARSRELGASDDIITQMLWRQVTAKTDARKGLFDDAERLAREAVALGRETDALTVHGDACIDLAEVLEAAGRIPEAVIEVETALALYEQKGDVPMADQARARLERLQ